MEHILRYKNEATKFQEALPVGNGRMGAMVYSKTDCERISLNEDTLWTGWGRENPAHEDPEAAFKKARALVLEGKIYEAEEILSSDFNSMWSQMYLPLGDLFISFGHRDVSEYKRELDLACGICKTQYKYGDVTYYREVFASFPDDIIAIKLSSDKSGALNFSYRTETKLKLKSTKFSDDISVLEAVCPTDGCCFGPSRNGREDVFLYDEKQPGISFALVVKLDTDGSFCEKDGGIFVSDAGEAVLYLSVKTSFNGYDKNPAAEGKEYIKPALDVLSPLKLSSYEDVRERHIADFSALFGRVNFSLTKTVSTEDTYERLKNFDGGDLGLYELLFQYGRYLSISCSRPGTQAANLQGIWNEEIYAPWNSNYTLNINAEMNYWHILTTNLAELFEPFLANAKKIQIQGRKTANKYYGARGFVCHHNTDLWGMTNPVGHAQGPMGCMWSFWNMSSGWICCQLFDAYEYTLDKKYLEDIYPIMCEAARFYLDVLYDDGGEYILCPTTSPENQYVKDGKRVSLSKSTTMTESILLELFDRIIRAGEILGAENEIAREVKEKYPKLKKPGIAPDGRLLEWAEDEEETEKNHRHVSHLYSLYPGTHISPEKTPELAEACRQSLLGRGDEGTGWSLGWKINLWANLEDGNHALDLIKLQLRLVEHRPGLSFLSGGGTYPNMMDAHPPFQIDGNFAACAAIANMLVKSELGAVKILPALPELWADGEASGIVAKGGVTVDMKWQGGKLTSLTLESKTAQKLKLTADGRTTDVELKAGVKTAII